MSLDAQIRAMQRAGRLPVLSEGATIILRRLAACCEAAEGPPHYWSGASTVITPTYGKDEVSGFAGQMTAVNCDFRAAVAEVRERRAAESAPSIDWGSLDERRIDGTADDARELGAFLAQLAEVLG